MLEAKIARRYLWMARKQAHTVFLSLISMLGLAVGVATLLFSLALLSGLQGQIKSRLIASSPQLLIEPAGSNTIANAPSIAEDARRQGLRDIRTIVSGMGWAANEEDKHGRPVRIRSFEPAYAPEPDTGSRRSSVAITASQSPIYMTRDAVASLGLDVGEQVTIVAPRTRLTPFGPVPVWRKYTIARLVRTSGEERSGDAYLPLAEAESLLGTHGQPTSMEMFGSSERSEEIQAKLAATFPEAQVKTWKEINRPLFLALRLEKVVMFATISLIIVVAALNLISSLSMLIMEKRPQVGVLRTLGATERMILSIFLQVGLFIGISGTIIGNLFGLGASWAANTFHLVPLPRDIYLVDYLPFTIERMDVLGVNIVAVLLAVLATWYPARAASRLDPITAIREE